MEERKLEKYRKLNRFALIVTALTAIAVLGLLCASLCLEGPFTAWGLGNKEDTISTVIPEKIQHDAAALEDESKNSIMDESINASSNLHLDIRREKAEHDTTADALADRQIYFAGVGDETLAYDTEILLENLEENEDFMMKYVVTDMDSGITVFETGLIPSGECVGWIPGHDLGEGEHHLNFHIAPYYPKGEKYLPLTSANNEVVFTIGGM